VAAPTCKVVLGSLASPVLQCFNNNIVLFYDKIIVIINQPMFIHLADLIIFITTGNLCTICPSFNLISSSDDTGSVVSLEAHCFSITRESESANKLQFFSSG